MEIGKTDAISVENFAFARDFFQRMKNFPAFLQPYSHLFKADFQTLKRAEYQVRKHLPHQSFIAIRINNSDHLLHSSNCDRLDWC